MTLNKPFFDGKNVQRNIFKKKVFDLGNFCRKQKGFSKHHIFAHFQFFAKNPIFHDLKIKKNKKILPFFLIFYSCFSNLGVIWSLINPFSMERMSKDIFWTKHFLTSEISVEKKKGLVSIIFLHFFQFLTKF